MGGKEFTLNNYAISIRNYNIFVIFTHLRRWLFLCFKVMINIVTILLEEEFLLKDVNKLISFDEVIKLYPVKWTHK